MRAGLCPDWPDWNPKDSLQNASEAMGLADDWLNVRQVSYTLIKKLKIKKWQGIQ